MSPFSPALFAASALVLPGVLAVCAASSPAHAAQSALKGPYVTAVSDTDATVRFELATAGPATLEVTTATTAGPDASTAKPRRLESREAAAMHSVHLSGLAPATAYAFVVRAGNAVVGEGRVVTAPAPDAAAPLTFLVYGDDRTDDVAHASVVRAMASVPSDFLVNTGDMVADGASAPNWQAFFDIEKPLLHDRELLPAIGNHELYDDAAGTNFARYFGFVDDSGSEHPYGTVRFGNARFFFLNGMDDWTTGEERSWLERELTKADSEPGLRWRFAVVHHGPWSAGPHGPNAKLLEARVPQLLGAHKVDIVFSGHDHLYERGDGGVLKYVLSGGGGAPLYRDLHPTPTTRKVEAAHHFVQVTLRGNTLQMVATRDDGSVLDKCGFTQGRPWDCDAPAAPALTVAAAGPSTPATPVAPAPASHACACAEPGEAGHAGGIAAAIAVIVASLRRFRLPRSLSAACLARLRSSMWTRQG